jgi:CRP-like cAMP-binding protein
MSPARRPNGSPGRKKITRPTPIAPVLQLGRSTTLPKVAAKARRDFDPHAFLATISEGRKLVIFLKRQIIFAQGDSADAVFYLQTGRVKLTVVSKDGRSNHRDIRRRELFEEGSLAGQPLAWALQPQ